MLENRSARWLNFLERHFKFIAIPNIAIIFVTLQGIGFLMTAADPAWYFRLALLPELVFQGELWRIVTFLALPISNSPVWVLFELWFLYFILNLLENELGAFKTTFYTLVSILITIAYSLIFNYPVNSVTHFQSTLFLATAALFPEVELRLFFAIPVKMKWLAWFSLTFLLLEFIRGNWLDRFFLIAIYSNFILFFGPAYASSIKQILRKRNFKNQFRN